MEKDVRKVQIGRKKSMEEGKEGLQLEREGVRDQLEQR